MGWWKWLYFYRVGSVSAFAMREPLKNAAYFNFDEATSALAY